MREAVLGVDVGTGSARAAVFDLAGRRLGLAAAPIRLWRPRADIAEQSADDIWQAVCVATRGARAQAGTVLLRGIGFDATCSLVLRDAAGEPVSASVEGDPSRDVIVWMDHRATLEAARINETGHPVLRYVGGAISPEMQTPKLLWLKQHLPRSWARAAYFFDLPDFLTWRATGNASRSLCSTVCKWTFLGHEGRWDDTYFRAIGLGELADEGFARIGTDIRPIAAPAGGLSPRAAAELGLPEGTPVATSAIDAHAGGLGVIGVPLGGETVDLERRLALIGGTSSCHMAVSPTPRYVPGVWGPYFSAMLPGLWLNEGGQSATGSLIDHVIASHAGLAEAQGEGSIYEALNARLDVLAGRLGFPAALTRALHVDPDFHGNRSPHADPSLRGTVAGLTLAAGADELALLYLATVQAIAYGTREIIAALNQGGYAIDTILTCGGGTRNPMFLREHADATGCRLVLPEEPEAVLLGAALLGAVAGGAHTDLPAAMRAMTRAGAVIEPAGGAAGRYHDAKFAVFRRLHADQLAWRRLMDLAEGDGLAG